MLLRAALVLLYPVQFAELSLGDFFHSALYGLRIDSATISMLFSINLLALLIPFRFAESVWWQRLWLYLALLPMWGVLILSCASLAYFGEVSRHIGTELVYLRDDWPLVFDLISTSRTGFTLFSLAFVITATFFWIKWVMPTRASNSNMSFIARLGTSFVMLLLLVLGARGWVPDGKPINVIDAYSLGSSAKANLALNGAFTAFQTSRNLSQKSQLSAREMKEMEEEFGENTTNPFLQQYVEHPITGKNIVFVLLESWSYKYIDALAGNNFGVTPNMDNIVHQSRVYDQHFAAAQRSIRGIQAILTSVPVLPGQPQLSEGLELIETSHIGELAHNAGYQSLMVQSSTRRSFRMDSVSASLGFDHYFGQEDIPLLREYPQDTPRFGWDYDTLMFFEKQLDTLAENNKPFFGFAFTGTTHEPFADPGEKFHHFPHQSRGEAGFLNTVYYADWAIGEFIREAKKKPWFDNTIFIFTADHVLHDSGGNLRELFRVPLIIYAPKIFQPERSEKVVSQYDMLPTILDLMGVNEPFVAFGESLFKDERLDEAWVSQGDVLGVIRNNATMQHTLKHLLNVDAPNKPTEFTQQLESHFLAQSRQATALLALNRWVKGAKPGAQQPKTTGHSSISEY